MVSSSSSSHTHKISISTPHLTLRPIHPSETRQFRTLRSDPKNNLFAAIPDPQTRERSLALGIGYAAEQGIINLFVILKPSSSPTSSSKKDHENKEDHEFEKECGNLKVEEGLAIGVMQICPPDPESGEKASEIGGYIHHPLTGMGYGTEAFGAVVNYALEDLAKEEVVLETKKGNLGFRGVMRSLGLEGLEGPGRAWIEDGMGKRRI